MQAGELAPRFDDVYRAHFQPLVVQLYAYVGDMTEAQDLVQEAFSRAWPRWDKIARYDDPVAWVRRVAWNTATSRWRRLRTARRYLERQRPENVPGPGPDRVALTAALATLPPNQRRAVVLHHLADLSINEIALECEVAPGTVKSWLHRARTALAARLGETGADGQAPGATPGTATARKPPEPTSRMEVI
ncbi:MULTISPECIES: RNA polymerase sigma factor [unclassified Plantactinospora]|uniref:RNA polymerase sigma factor n=1 Tax=unclassified Plantactinospora TaxID=2631981 RepID=UPI000D154FF3|nr:MULTISPECIES: SigE family RNA polymerase sigma factor [unclassified Plantactinospora]AVT34834.1 SigE family RNA polymerase sigma factor [Plantactinospora sp. BC1]AVT41790.1 SigE family RNA polymerase sigma factor [Plantactinospora sp. BB1]